MSVYLKPKMLKSMSNRSRVVWNCDCLHYSCSDCFPLSLLQSNWLRNHCFMRKRFCHS